ncbi:enoyl-CoA delta isomerase 1, mitochondrial-like isoform X2 [Musca autumnalis]
MDERTGFATLSMNRPPVNLLNLEMFLLLTSSIKELEQNKCRGVILTSTSDSVFSAGLDIKEMYQPNVERLREFWTAFQDTWLAWYGTGLPTLALINGHSPAGGCVLSTCCEYRIMLPNFKIGLNEAQFGLVAPNFVRASFRNVLTNRIAEMALYEGKMFQSAEALNIGLVDELANSKEEGHEKCIKFLQTFSKVDPLTRSLTKQQFRGKDLDDLRRDKKRDMDDFVEFVTQSHIQMKLGSYLEKLKNKSQK